MSSATGRGVRVVPYGQSWAGAFADEAATLRSVFGDLAKAIHHIGSTSVPGLAAKPTIDVLVEVRRIGDVDALCDAMAATGHEAWGEYGIPGRRFFVKNRGTVRTHNIHVFEADGPEVGRHLAFRDYLTRHPETAAAYGHLKEKLARKFPRDMEAYMNGKDAFVKRVEREALSWARARTPQAGRPETPC